METNKLKSFEQDWIRSGSPPMLMHSKNPCPSLLASKITTIVARVINLYKKPGR